MHLLPEVDVLVLTHLAKCVLPVSIGEVAQALDLDQSKVSVACLTQAESGWVQLEEVPELELRLGPKAKELKDVLPERAMLEALARAEGPMELNMVGASAGLETKEAGQSLRWLQAKGWASKDGRTLTLLPAGKEAVGVAGADERLLELLRQKAGEGAAGLREEDVRAAGIDVAAARALLSGRSGFLEERKRTRRNVLLTESGRRGVAEGLEVRRQVNQLSNELLLNGGWRNVEIRPYDIQLEAQPRYPGKEHPLVSIFQQARRVFLEMGFTEIVSPWVESSFWDFDALFQPQDHPAREMQDTFYVAVPERSRLPNEDLVSRVARTHEDGGNTGSVGWRYRWDPRVASRPVLRTHTTATTIRALEQNPAPPRKVYCVGPVFRRETIDYKHLPVFHQIDGIIIDEHASFASLLGTLSAFYHKMGFERFQFRPGFFPYTEPSVEVFVWSNRKNDWVEMGGAGVFRPEVTQPLGCSVPVLAWGLGLERVAMFRYDLPSIAELYRARLSFLKETPLCR